VTADSLADQGAADAVGDARRLWCGRFQGVLSTHSAAEPGFPFGSVVPVCLSNAGEPLLLLSHLAQHSRNLGADPRAALTLFDTAGDDIQQGRRLTCMGRCEPYDDPVALARWCRHFPQGRVYAERLNFRLHRLLPLRCHYNGGFGTARWLGVDRLLERIALDPECEQMQLRMLAEQHAGWLSTQAVPGCAAPPLAAGVDHLGVTLRCDERLLRLEADTALADTDALTACIHRGGLATPG